MRHRAVRRGAVVIVAAALPLLGSVGTGAAAPLGMGGVTGLPATSLAVVSCAAGWSPPAAGESWSTALGAPGTSPSDYYAIELVPTGRVPGTGLSRGVAYATAAPSPFFGVSLAPAGEYLSDLDIRVENLKPLARGAYVAWVTDSEVSEIVRVGALDESLRVRGQAKWNKFLVVITREPGDQPTDTWEGPVILRGMSRSGRMHTMAGHGPFQLEPCAKYGFR